MTAPTDAVPENRLHLTLDLHADNLNEVRRVLRGIGFRLETEGQEDREITSGGYGSSWHLRLTCNPEQTGDRYREQLAEWSHQRKEARP